MALVKVKPTSPGRRAVVKVVTPDLHKGAPYAPLLEKQIQNAEIGDESKFIRKNLRVFLG